MLLELTIVSGTLNDLMRKIINLSSYVRYRPAPSFDLDGAKYFGTADKICGVAASVFCRCT